MKTTSMKYHSLGMVALSAVFAVTAGCAPQGSAVRPNDAHAGQPVATQASSGCNTGAAVAIGALAGAFLGKGKGHLVGAAVGAGIGAIACTAYNYHARQVRDGRAVEADYKRDRGALPLASTVSSYTSSLEPGNTVRSGAPVALRSNVVVIHGTQDQAPRVAETLTLLSPEGKALSTVTKPASDISGTGEYQTDFSFTLPKGVENGRYTVRSSVSMNDKVVRTNDTPMLVVS